MTVASPSGKPVISLNKNPPENFCRPAVDPMLRSIVAHYGRNVLTVILTGMGQDGLRGCEAVVSGGGSVLAQDEATSVVWGMPGAVATAGLCTQVLPLKEIGPAIRRIVARPAA
jgi:two-component system, chemotaxis family, protein-glutamate methylesterase/glutaminase